MPKQQNVPCKNVGFWKYHWDQTDVKFLIKDILRSCIFASKIFVAYYSHKFSFFFSRKQDATGKRTLYSIISDFLAKSLK